LIGVFMTVLFVGGYSTQWGPLIAAPILYGLPLFFPTEVQSWRIVIYGLLLILVLELKPEGFITRKFVHSLGLSFSRKRAKEIYSKEEEQ